MANERVQRKDGSYVNVVASDKADLSDAVSAAKSSDPTTTININRPGQEGHDLVVNEADGSSRLSDRIPETALNFDPEVEQKFNGKTGLGGDASNSPSAKAAAEAKADEALKMQGPSTEADLQVARKEVASNNDKVAAKK